VALFLFLNNGIILVIDTGTVIITGNLDVRGVQTAISSTNTNVRDNILVLNAGESNSYDKHKPAVLEFMKIPEMSKASTEADKKTFKSLN
jgi:hypothetical protein